MGFGKKPRVNTNGSKNSVSQQQGALATMAKNNSQNNSFACASRFFIHILAVIAQLRHETFLHVISGACFME